MTTHLFKVASPREDGMFYPSTFWRMRDWESSTTCRREGYIEDEVLFAGDFDEVNIHLFPRVRTVRVRSAETISIAEAMKRWNVQACYVNSLDGLIERLTQEGIYFDEQT